MAKEKKFASAKRFGTRYGRTTKRKFATIENLQRSKHKCPSCRKDAVKRVSKGIWQCKKCNLKFTGKAYVPEGA
ncbi:50S ribosomal protein L37ae [Candidatus Woesearchaeota archaeon]|nr:50S ribosomal protein L37ae [Candidatus Woesearchaeota archaeon]